MKKLYIFISFLFTALSASAQTYCDPQGNVMLFSNYDGGVLVINCDANIPNLKIGVVSYEFSRIEVIGPYASNVTQIWYVGYNGNNNHCNLSPPLTTTITGVANAIDSILIYPPATYSNPNGYGSIICNYSCNTTTNQGGCNTADQIAHYFLTNFGGSLYAHRTLYGCWPDTADVSFGGNCCANPLTTIEEQNQTLFSLAPNPATNSVNISMPMSSEAQTVQITNMIGETVCEIQIPAGTTSQQISLESFASGTYFFRMQSGENITTEKLVITE